MSDNTKPTLTPSLVEFTGWYNIQGDYGDGHPVLRSDESLPEFEYAELLDLYPQAAQWFDELVEARPNIPFDPLVPPPFFVCSDTDDRTLIVEADFSYLSVPLLRRIQKEFLGQHPLWRIVLVGEGPPSSIVVYPTAIRFGDLPADSDPEQALRDLVPRVLALCAARERPQRKHIAQMRQLLPKAVAAIADQPFSVAGVLDNYGGNHDRQTVCLLIRGSDGDAILPDGLNGLLAYGSEFGVDANGALLSRIHVPEVACFCLVSLIVPADYRGPLPLTERATGRRYTLDLRSEDIIRTTSEK